MTEVKFETVLNNYKHLIKKPLLRNFMLGNGELCLATERISTEIIDFLYQEGHFIFAEKYAKELQDKRQSLAHLPSLRFNYFGSIQTNKIKKVLQHCEVLEGISTARHAQKVAQLLPGLNQKMRCYVQINTGKEPQKKGVLPEEAAALIAFCKDLQLPLQGLMCIPPKAKNAEEDYRFVRKLADKFQLEYCQMGFSHDYQVAINCGATAIRIGSLVFGNHA